jgi:uncharacterized repeat protein (TIGR03803 family)
MTASIGRAARLAALLPVIAAALPAPAAFASDTATGYQLVHVFDVSQGRTPRGLLQASDRNLYGVTSSDGQFGGGTLYRMAPSGKFTVLHDFGKPGTWDGREPVGALVQASDGNLYGVTVRGGHDKTGIVYRLTPEGGYTIVHDFGRMTDCAHPAASLVEAPDGNLYGSTLKGGGDDIGCVYRLSLDGSFAAVYAFTWHDGYSVQDPLIVGQDGLLYGTAQFSGGGRSAQGAIFRVSMAGAYEVIHTFRGPDGAYPCGPLIQAADGSFYGTTAQGGANLAGTVFRLAPDGRLTTLHNFPEADGDGRLPYTGLLDPGDGFLYGTTELGGDPSCVGGCGTVFRIAPDGSNEAVVHAFAFARPGAFPSIGDELIRAQDGHLFGTATDNGGNSPVTGTIYELSEPAP